MFHFLFTVVTTILWLCPTVFSFSYHTKVPSTLLDNQVVLHAKHFASDDYDDESRRKLLFGTLPSLLLRTPVLLISHPEISSAKCTDIDSCREAGERKIEKDLAENPITKLDFGVKYKVLQAGTGEEIVSSDDTLDIIFSVSTLGGGYMYSRGFGYEKINFGGGNGNGKQLVSDAGLDSIRVKLGERNVPIGVEEALIGMKRGERRRVEVPPIVGFETSQWNPEPTSSRGKASLKGYKRLIEGGNGSTQPPFPVASIWDIEVLKIRK